MSDDTLDGPGPSFDERGYETVRLIWGVIEPVQMRTGTRTD